MVNHKVLRVQRVSTDHSCCWLNYVGFLVLKYVPKSRERKLRCTRAWKVSHNLHAESLMPMGVRIGARCPGTEDGDGCEPLYGMLGPKPGSSVRAISALLTTQLFLSTLTRLCFLKVFKLQMKSNPNHRKVRARHWPLSALLPAVTGYQYSSCSLFYTCVDLLPLLLNRNSSSMNTLVYTFAEYSQFLLELQYYPYVRKLVLI